LTQVLQLLFQRITFLHPHDPACLCSVVPR
jgi:hypothetical protein